MHDLPPKLRDRIDRILKAAELSGPRARAVREDLAQHARDALDRGVGVDRVLERLGDPAVVGPLLAQSHVPDPKQPDRTREPLFGSLLSDLRFGARTLSRTPVIALTSGLVLTLAIAANTVVFTAVNELVLRPLPVEDQAGLIDVWPNVEGGNSFLGFGWEDFQSYQAAEPLDALAAFSGLRLSIGEGTERNSASATLISPEYAPMLGLQASMGTMDFAGGNRPGDAPVAVLSHAFWTARFGADPGVLGRTIQLDEQPVTVVGVGPEDFRGHFIGFPTDLWMPAATAGLFIPGFDRADRSAMPFEMIGRLRPGASPTEARIALNRIAEDLERTFPDTHEGRRVGVSPTTGVDHSLQGPLQAFLAVLTAVAALVLLIACLNVGGVLLIRTLARDREMAVRLALGAGNGRLVRQLAAEALLLSALGAVGGLLLAVLLNARLAGLFSTLAAGLGLDLALDARVLTLTTLATVAAAALAVITPALYLLRQAPASALATRAEPIWSGRARAVLVLGQVAVSVALVVATGLFLRSLAQGLQADPGFDPDRLAVFAIETQGQDRPLQPEVLSTMVDELASLSGVEDAAFADASPIGVARSPVRIQVPGLQPPVGSEAWVVDGRRVGQGWFGTVGIPIQEGRDFTRGETVEGPPVAIVSESFARSFWPGGAVVGRSFFLAADPETPIPVVGIVADAQYLAQDPDPDPVAYLSLAGRLPALARITLRTSVTGPDAVDLRAVVSRYRTSSQVPTLTTPRQVLNDALLPQRMGAVVVGGMGLAGLFLACVGLYGLVQFTVARQHRELALRRALGGTRPEIVRRVLGKGLRVVVVGIAVGLLLAALSARALSGFLLGVSPTDPLTYGAVAGLFVAIATLASWIPAYRAASVEPSQALRGE